MKNKYSLLIITVLTVVIFIAVAIYKKNLTDIPPVEQPQVQLDIADNNLQAAPVPQHDIHNKNLPGQTRQSGKYTQISSFSSWLNTYLAADQNGQEELLQQGINLATVRKKAMILMIQTDPAKALGQAISYHEYDQLPEEVKSLMEQPFSVRANIVILPNESNQSVEHEATFLETNIKGFKSSPILLYGKRQHILSKNNIAAQGILLDGLAAIYDDALQILTDPQEQKWASEQLLDNPSGAGIDSFTGEEIKGSSVMAVAGGMIFYFNNTDNVQTYNEQLATLEQQAGPNNGSQRLFLQSSEGQGNQVVDEPEGDDLQASPWTETKKAAFFIRVDFADDPGASTSKIDLENKLNGDVSEYIQDYSYTKTWIEGTVSDLVVRLPQNSSYYAPDEDGYDKSSELHNDARTAFINLDTGIDLSDYDIIGVHFTNIGMYYTGLASVGGSSHWLQDTLSTAVIVHEFGHNYGLSHANFWDTAGSSVVGAGDEISYGDIFDRMGSGDTSAHFHIQGKSRLNWLTTSQWNEVTVSGNHRIYRFDHRNAQNIQGLRVEKGSGEYYWLGYRLNFTTNQWLQKGAYIIWQRPGVSRSVLIDTTPGSPGGKDDAGIALGRTYSDITAGIHITPVGHGGISPDEWLDLQINFGDFTGNNDPTVSIDVPATLAARTPLTFTANGLDSDGDQLAYFWDFGDGRRHDNVKSISQAWTAGGNYTVKVTATDMKGGTATSEINVTVTDPMTAWTARTSNTSKDLHDVAKKTDQVMAVGREVVVSSDGTTWTKLNDNFSLNVYIYGLVHDDNQWIAVGMDWDFIKDLWVGVIYTSTDGTIWVQRHFGGIVLNDIATDTKSLVAVGDEGLILHSTGGVNWSPQPSGTDTDLQGVAYGDDTFTAVGSLSNGGTVVVLTSPDGTSWTDHSSGSGLASWQGFKTIEYLGDRFLASGWHARIRHSIDLGLSFTTTRSSTEEIPAFAYGNGVYFAAGVDRDNSNADIDLVSTDGAEWFSFVTPDLDTRNSAIYFNNTFITVGLNGSIRQSGPIGVPSQLLAGDLDGNGSVELNDAIKTLQIIAGEPAGIVILASDVNSDRQLGLAEAVYILRKVANL